MKSKILLVFIAFIFLSSFVLATETIPLKTVVNVTYDSNSSTLRIQGENLDWTKTIQFINNTNSTNSTSWDTSLEILMIKEIGNASDITNLYAMANECLNQTVNFVKWHDLAQEKDLALSECVLNVSYVDNYTECEKSLDSFQNYISPSEYQKAKDDLAKANSQKSWFTIGTIVFGLVTAYFLFTNREKLLGGRKEERSNLPLHTSV